MSDWWTTTIGEIAEIFDGPHATPKRTEAGPWFLNIGSLRSGRLDLSESAHISEADFGTWTRRVTPLPGDVLFSYETRLGEAALMPSGLRACLGRRMGLLRPRPGEVDSRFLLYTYLAPKFQQVIRQRTVHGATVDRIPLNELPSWPITLPSMQYQRAIAALLGGLDDKIESNTSALQAANRLAGAIFEQTFEQREPAVLVRLGDLAEVIDCLHSRKPDFVEGGLRYLVLADIRDDSRLTPLPNFTISNDDYGEWTRRIEAHEGDCLLTNVGRVGAVGQIPRGCTAAIGRNMTAIRGRQGCPPAFLVEALRSATVRREIDVKTDQGTVMSALSVRSMPNLLIPAGDAQDRQGFQEKVGPLHELQDHLLQENAHLAAMRDVLLPKLMSGEIRVREAERIVEGAT